MQCSRYGAPVNARFLSHAIATGWVLPALLMVACGGDLRADASDDADGGAQVCATPPAPQKPTASCEVTIATPPIEPVLHVPEGTLITYCSNPPSSGRHYPIWAAFQEYSAPVEWPYLVHSMEHGAVLLLYKCDAAGCPDVVDQLRKIRDDAPIDPLCEGQGTARRIIIAPSTTIDTEVAAAAWGATYRAPCVDTPTLATFVRDHYAKGPENFCTPGRTF